jgi:hypothetical protein
VLVVGMATVEAADVERNWRRFMRAFQRSES